MQEIIDYKQACAVLHDSFPSVQLMSVYDYKDWFIFVVSPNLLGYIAVTKSNGSVIGFNAIAAKDDDFVENFVNNRILLNSDKE